MNGLEGKIEVIELVNGVVMLFAHAPSGYNLKNITLSGHDTTRIGRLRSFNRIKRIAFMKEHSDCLVTLFTDQLKRKGWDFEKFPNPMAAFAVERK